MILRKTSLLSLVLAILVMGMFALSAHAAPPVVKTVPWVASNPLIPHDTYPTKSVTLKGTSDRQGGNISYVWDFGDGTPVATGTVSNMYAIEAKHTYGGPVGTLYVARLTVTDNGTGEQGSQTYYVKMQNKTLDVEVNIAIDEGLWAMHKAMNRYNCSTTAGLQCGDWSGWTGNYGIVPSNVNAFEVNGHLETGPASDPYTETVTRGIRRMFELLAAWNPAPNYQPLANAAGSTWDGNGNGWNVYSGDNWPYQTSMFTDALVATGTPNAVAPTGGANIKGQTYKTLVQDTVDVYSACMYPDPNYGGWRYSCQSWPDNSVSQWGAIGFLGPPMTHPLT